MNQTLELAIAKQALEDIDDAICILEIMAFGKAFTDKHFPPADAAEVIAASITALDYLERAEMPSIDDGNRDGLRRRAQRCRAEILGHMQDLESWLDEAMRPAVLRMCLKPEIRLRFCLSILYIHIGGDVNRYRDSMKLAWPVGAPRTDIDPSSIVEVAHWCELNRPPKPSDRVITPQPILFDEMPRALASASV